jgi:hypothetical protein
LYLSSALVFQSAEVQAESTLNSSPSPSLNVACNFMRYTTLIILTLFISTFASAKCGSHGIYCLSNNSLNKNGIIILEFYASSQSLIPDLNFKYPIYLKSSSGKVKLEIIETLTGEFNVTQIVLKPVSELKANETYTLLIDKLPKNERIPGRYKNHSNKWEPLRFRIKNLSDTNIPILIGTPVEEKKTLIYFGCGPATWVYFKILGQDQSEIFIRTTVKNLNNGNLTSYILPIENDLINIGHGMCSGPFHFDNSENFEITFQLYDESGNKSSLTNAISFRKPTVLTQEE